MTQDKADCVQRYYESLESWDMEFGKVYRIHGRQLPMTGENSFLWAGLLHNSELRQVLDELFEHALEGASDSREGSRVPEAAFSQR